MARDPVVGTRESAPILNDLPAVKDALDFEPYVATLTGIAASRSLHTPLTVGVFGTWGSGKTSLMRMVCNSLPDDFCVAWFDAWKYAHEAALWRALLLQVLATLRAAVAGVDSNESTKALAELTDLETALYRTVAREEVGGVQIDWGKLAASLTQGAVQIGLSFIPGGSVLSDLVEKVRNKKTQAAAENLVDAIHRERSKIHIEQVQFLEQFQDRFNKLVGKHVEKRGRRLVVFVDDLDRCLPEKAVEVLEAIKLFLDVPGCVFILGLDQEVIARGIEIKYRELGLSGGASGEDRKRFLIDGTRYLEKIIQVPFQIPPIERGHMGSFVKELVREWPHEECPRVFAEGLGDNPRQVKRTLNVFLMLWQLARKRHVQEIKPVRLAKVVAVQHVYPALYEVLKGTPRLLRELEDYYREESSSSMDGKGRGKAERVEPPPALAPFIHRASVRRLFNLHPLDMPEANFTGLSPDELRLYFTLTRRVETPQMTAVEDSRSIFEPQTVHIPAGEFLMGSTEDDEDADSDERPQHSVKLTEYSIGKYPVSNAEYHGFVRTSGRRPPAHWDGDTYPEEKGDHPVVNVSWHDAMAYCQWLSKETNRSYSLPTEAEWEKAARGKDGRIYPWGNGWDQTKVNSQEAGPGDTTPVGQYSPDGDSPYGVADMAGNVWEWTSSIYKGYPYNPEDGLENQEEGDSISRVLRGGAFSFTERFVRCAFRFWYLPDYWVNDIGFRVVLSPSSSGL